MEQDIEKAIEYFKEAIDRGNESAIIDLGVLFVNGEFIEPDYEKAYNLFKPLADRGIADAQYNIGSMFERGHHVKKDLERAFDYYNKAHIQGFPIASYAVGEFYYNGTIGDGPSYKLAIKYFKAAAEQDYALAYYSLGFMTQHGEGVPVDIPKAINFYRQAADLGDTSAMIALGDIFADPKLDLYSIEEARKFYKKAYENGDSLAPAILARTYNPFISGYQDSTNSKSFRKKIEDVQSREWYAKAIEMESYDVLFEYAESFSMSGDFETGVKVALEGLDILTKSNHPDTSIKAHLYSLLAYYYNIQGFGSDAIRVMELAENLITNNEYWDNLS